MRHIFLKFNHTNALLLQHQPRKLLHAKTAHTRTKWNHLFSENKIKAVLMKKPSISITFIFFLVMKRRFYAKKSLVPSKMRSPRSTELTRWIVSHECDRLSYLSMEWTEYRYMLLIFHYSMIDSTFFWLCKIGNVDIPMKNPIGSLQWWRKLQRNLFSPPTWTIFANFAARPTVFETSVSGTICIRKKRLFIVHLLDLNFYVVVYIISEQWE